jgi:hypothetical protein
MSSDIGHLYKVMWRIYVISHTILHNYIILPNIATTSTYTVWVEHFGNSNVDNYLPDESFCKDFLPKTKTVTRPIIVVVPKICPILLCFNSSILLCPDILALIPD